MKKRKDLAKYLRYVTAFLLFGIVFVTILQVFFRFVLDSPLTWTDELGRFLLVWVVFLGVGVVSLDDRHLAVNMLQEYMPPIVQLITSFIIRAVIIVFLVIVIYSSQEVIAAAHSNTTGALDIPYSWWRIAAPVGSGLMIIFTIIRSVYDFLDFRNGVYQTNSTTEEEVKE
ncbi:TRAP transporter small permease [Halobacillus campisalis]|uniref:TRAP transporter small permease n=1 Tax=Halobacillus campisalis TaxID=435909 RepID=A0ABW2JZ05_9BACI|nr:TRAP transporter small permease [Halobacillus campisalis]